MNRPDLAASLENLRCDVAAAVHAWREAGGKDEDLALLVDGLHSPAPLVAAMARTDVPRAVTAFDPVTAIELAQHPPHLAPVVLDLPYMVRRILWVDIDEHERPSAALRGYWQTSAVRFTAQPRW